MEGTLGAESPEVRARVAGLLAEKLHLCRADAIRRDRGKTGPRDRRADECPITTSRTLAMGTSSRTGGRAQSGRDTIGRVALAGQRRFPRPNSGGGLSRTLPASATGKALTPMARSA